MQVTTHSLNVRNGRMNIFQKYMTKIYMCSYPLKCGIVMYLSLSHCKISLLVNYIILTTNQTYEYYLLVF